MTDLPFVGTKRIALPKDLEALLGRLVRVQERGLYTSAPGAARRVSVVGREHPATTDPAGRSWSAYGPRPGTGSATSIVPALTWSDWLFTNGCPLLLRDPRSSPPPGGG